MAEVYQFKITLRRTKPPIWRRIQVPAKFNFKQLHGAIQDAMGWMGHHAHSFTFKGAGGGEYQIMDAEFAALGQSMFSDKVEELDEKKESIAEHFTEEGKSSAIYEYDFGDGWEHKVLFEKTVESKKGVDYPICVTGKRACPVEDCGGVDGFYELLEKIADPKHEEHAEMVEWMEGLGYLNYDPAVFKPEDVFFEKVQVSSDEDEEDEEESDDEKEEEEEEDSDESEEEDSEEKEDEESDDNGQ